eukprot:Awhi_evm1s13483
MLYYFEEHSRSKRYDQSLEGQIESSNFWNKVLPRTFPLCACSCAEKKPFQLKERLDRPQEEKKIISHLSHYQTPKFSYKNYNFVQCIRYTPKRCFSSNLRLQISPTLDKKSNEMCSAENPSSTTSSMKDPYQMEDYLEQTQADDLTPISLLQVINPSTIKQKEHSRFVPISGCESLEHQVSLDDVSGDVPRLFLKTLKERLDQREERSKLRAAIEEKRTKKEKLQYELQQETLTSLQIESFIRETETYYKLPFYGREGITFFETGKDFQILSDQSADEPSK